MPDAYDAAGPSGSSARKHGTAKATMVDDDLIALCQDFRCTLRSWIAEIEKLDIESYSEKPAEGQALHTLREAWGSSLKKLGGSIPRTVAGAHEKLFAAQEYLSFSCEADGSALELLARALCELNQVHANLCSTDDRETARRVSTQRSPWWLERLTRRA
jgi:hypothetical protein